MSRARHKLRAGGGKMVKADWEAGGKTEEAKEAEEKKRGGRVHKAEGHEAEHRADKKARGGHVKKEHEKKRAKGGGVKTDMEGNHAAEIHSVKGHSMVHKRGRARGGGVGADRKPLTTAANVKQITPGEKPNKGIYNPVKESDESIEG